MKSEMDTGHTINRVLNSKPHTIQAIKIEFPFRGVAPDWLLDAYKKGRASATYEYRAVSYITIMQGDKVQRGYEGQWLCINQSGQLFILTDEEVRRGFTGW